MKDKPESLWLLEIDFSKLMDLRIDYAFKLFFGMGDTRFLILLLNAVFANKKIPRVIKSLTVVNPYLEKYSKADKLAVLDIRAELDDGTGVLIEMHLYDIDVLKYKTIRSWARAFGEDLKEGEEYADQPPVICVAFVNGPIEGDESRKIHKYCKITDAEDHTVFSDALELHYINMQAFVKVVNEAGGTDSFKREETLLAKWIAIIAEKDIKDKEIIRKICEDREEFKMAVSELVRLSEDKIIRHAYQKRREEAMLQETRKRRMEARIEEMKARMEQESRRAEAAEARIEQESRRADSAEAETEKLRLMIAALEADSKP